MWTTILLNTILSIIIIVIANQIWEYCKINYTHTKIKNLAETHSSKYRQIAEDISAASTVSPQFRKYTNVSDSSETSALECVDEELKISKLKKSDFIFPEEKQWIHNELTLFIDSL